MSFFQNPVGPPSPYKNYRVDALEQKKHREEPPPLPPEKKNPLLQILSMILTQCTRWLKRFLSGGLTSQEQSAIRTHLIALKNAIEQLKKEDVSQSGEWLEKLSNIWSLLQQDLSLIPRTTPFFSLFEKLLSSIERYPPGQDHRLGYYLNAFVGSRWLPFPLMEMLQSLHATHQKDPMNSSLASWNLQIERLLDLFSKTK